MRPGALRLYLSSIMDDELAREYVANALYLLMTEQRADKSAKRLGEILRADEHKDDRSGGEILNDIKGKLRRRVERRENAHADGH